eukprot:4731458-Alexandrium_andersonii.AAC.1
MSPSPMRLMHLPHIGLMPLAVGAAAWSGQDTVRCPVAFYWGVIWARRCQMRGCRSSASSNCPQPR